MCIKPGKDYNKPFINLNCPKFAFYALKFKNNRYSRMQIISNQWESHPIGNQIYAN